MRLKIGVEAIIESLEESLKDQRVQLPLFNSKLEKLFLWSVAFVVLLIISALIWNFLASSNVSRIFGLVAGFSLIALGITYQLLMAVFVILFLSNPTKLFLGKLKQELVNEAILIENLSKIDLSAASYVADRLELDSNQLMQRIYALVGAIEKVGSIPALIAAYFSIQKLLTDLKVAGTATTTSGAEYVFYGLAGLYGIAVVSMFVFQRFKVYVAVLKQAIKEGEANKALQPTPKSGAAEL